MEATTTRALTWTKSRPATETRIHASMTMPLSSTRSSTSIRLASAAIGFRAMHATRESYGIASLVLTVCGVGALVSPQTSCKSIYDAEKIDLGWRNVLSFRQLSRTAS